MGLLGTLKHTSLAAAAVVKSIQRTHTHTYNQIIRTSLYTFDPDLDSDKRTHNAIWMMFESNECLKFAIIIYSNQQQKKKFFEMKLEIIHKHTHTLDRAMSL